MNRLTISPNDVVYYQYHPESDALEVRFHSGDGPAREEPLAEMPLLSLLRDPESGVVLGLRVSSVQQFLLQKLVQELATIAQSYVTLAPPAKEPPAKPTRSRKKQSEAPEPVAEELPSPPVEVEAAAEMILTHPEEEAPAKPKRSRSRKKSEPEPEVEEAPTRPTRSRSRKKSEPEPEVVAAEAVEAPAEPEAPPAKPTRSRSRKKSEPEPEVVAAEAVEAPAEPEAPPAKPTRSRSRKKSEPEPKVAAVEAVEGPAESEAATEEAEALAEEEPSKSKRRRSRRKKKTTGEKEEAAVALSAPPEPPATNVEAEQEPASEVSAEEKSKRKRRRKRKRGKGTSEAEATKPPATQPTQPTQPQPQPVGAKRETEGARSPYKTAPIPGLETPEAFGFMNMNPLLGQAIAALGFEAPTPIQRRAVPPGMTGRDIIGLAQTGTGKTMAFLIPAVHRLLQSTSRDHRPRLLVLVPTRELAVQVAEEAEFLSTHTDLHISTIYGGVSIDAQIKDLKRGTDIIVATPGRLLDHLNRGNVRLDAVEVLVLDEADRMLDMGFLPEIRTIVRRVPTERQTMLFSATMPPAIQSLSLDFQRDPEVIEVARQLPPETIEQYLYPVERHLKTPLLVHLLQQDAAMRSILVFTETKIEADVLARKLREAEIQVGLMHGDRSQREREEALNSLRTGSVRLLVATDVAARGLDINDISHVVNYDIPQTVDSYVHRIGRTARGEAEGKAYTFVSSADEGMVKRIESALERTLPRVKAEGFNYDVPTPSWAKPSSEEIIETLNQPKGLADRFRRMIRRG